MACTGTELALNLHCKHYEFILNMVNNVALDALQKYGIHPLRTAHCDYGLFA